MGELSVPTLVLNTLLQRSMHKRALFLSMGELNTPPLAVSLSAVSLHAPSSLPRDSSQPSSRCAASSSQRCRGCSSHPLRLGLGGLGGLGLLSTVGTNLRYAWCVPLIDIAEQQLPLPYPYPLP